ncbi:MAG: ABC transporter permease [Bacteroidales bacterium]
MLKYLIEKEFKQFIRNSFLPRLALMFPIMTMFIFPWVATMDITGINVVIVDTDHSVTSRRLIDKISSSTYFSLYDIKGSYDDAIKDINYGKADIILEIPCNFEKDIVNRTGAIVGISANSVDGTKGGLGANYLTAIVSDFALELSADVGAVNKPLLGISVQNHYNPTLNYHFFMIPAIMIILIIMMCGFLPALNIVSEKEIGTIEQINVTPVGKLAFITAKLIPYWVMGTAVFSLCLIIAQILYGLYPAGSYFTIYVGVLMFVLVMSGFGLLISNYSETMQQSMFLMFFFIMIFMLMSGLFTPVSSMPGWAQWVATFVPPRYIIDIMRGVYLKGSSFSDLWTDFAALGGFALFFNVWAILGYRKRN